MNTCSSGTYYYDNFVGSNRTYFYTKKVVGSWHTSAAFIENIILGSINATILAKLNQLELNDKKTADSHDFK